MPYFTTNGHRLFYREQGSGPVIETLHSSSETPAIRRQAQLLAARLPDIPVRFIPGGATAM